MKEQLPSERINQIANKIMGETELSIVASKVQAICQYLDESRPQAVKDEERELPKCSECGTSVAVPVCQLCFNNKPSEAVKDVKHIDGNTSDGYHTFNELYDHRCLLWINYCLTNPDKTYLVEEHFAGWFLLGKETVQGQISYHCPNKYLHLLKNIERRHPEFDGHTSNIVLVRLQDLACIENDKPSEVKRSGFCSAHRDGEDKSCSICYPSPSADEVEELANDIGINGAHITKDGKRIDPKDFWKDDMNLQYEYVRNFTGACNCSDLWAKKGKKDPSCNYCSFRKVIDEIYSKSAPSGLVELDEKEVLKFIQSIRDNEDLGSYIPMKMSKFSEAICKTFGRKSVSVEDINKVLFEKCCYTTETWADYVKRMGDSIEETDFYRYATAIKSYLDGEK